MEADHWWRESWDLGWEFWCERENFLIPFFVVLVCRHKNVLTYIGRLEADHEQRLISFCCDVRASSRIFWANVLLIASIRLVSLMVPGLRRCSLSGFKSSNLLL
mgnify:CR=1 FL=1|jgi:hypothetical protein